MGLETSPHSCDARCGSGKGFSVPAGPWPNKGYSKGGPTAPGFPGVPGPVYEGYQYQFSVQSMGPMGPMAGPVPGPGRRPPLGEPLRKSRSISRSEGQRLDLADPDPARLRRRKRQKQETRCEVTGLPAARCHRLLLARGSPWGLSCRRFPHLRCGRIHRCCRRRRRDLAVPRGVNWTMDLSARQPVRVDFFLQQADDCLWCLRSSGEISAGCQCLYLMM